ncbi:MAG TPA: cytochrome c3 family protein [Bacteroidota bacterium]
MKSNILTSGILLLALGALGVGRLLLPDAVAGAEEKSKFLKFSHQKHVSDVGVDCETCHKEIAENSKLGDRLIPDHTACQSCHGDELSKNCTFCHYSDKPEKIVVTPVRDIIIDHKKHVSDRKTKCLECHVGVDKAELASDIGLPKMNSCVACHNGQKAVNQCENCHRNLASLYPESHAKGNFVKDHKNYVRLNGLDAQCQACHADNFCSQCHDGSNLTKLSSGTSIGMISPRTLGNDKPKALAGQSVHDINYRFTHAVDAKAKTTECQTCHNTRTFCNDCHENGTQGDGGTLPASHRIPGFALRGGYGSGGGRHADLARKNIEQCASCHDAEGNEPTCVFCHSDNDGIKHTDPKTHVTGFMNTIHGEWHSNPGATCFVCHTDANARPSGAKGRGFCGYCHS